MPPVAKIASLSRGISLLDDLDILDIVYKLKREFKERILNCPVCIYF